MGQYTSLLPDDRHQGGRWLRETLRAVRASTLVLVALLCSACAAHAHLAVPDQFVSLNDHSLRLHFDNGDAPVGRPLLVYATGDGGMHRKDLDTYRHLVALGDPIVGFDARDYVKHLGSRSPTTTPERLADDYRRVITRAKQALGLNEQSAVVLVGVSRGAGLAVVAAGRLRESIDGVVAVALTQEEEYVRWYRHLPLPHETHQPVMVNVYEYLAQLGDLPIAVVQSTHDQYLAASLARQQFGPDTANRWFQAIEATNHNFGGARSRMYDAIQAAVEWVTTRRAAAGSLSLRTFGDARYLLPIVGASSPVDVVRPYHRRVAVGFATGRSRIGDHDTSLAARRNRSRLRTPIQ